MKNTSIRWGAPDEGFNQDLCHFNQDLCHFTTPPIIYLIITSINNTTLWALSLHGLCSSFPNLGQWGGEECWHCIEFAPAQQLTIGSFVFFWNCTSLTLVMFSISTSASGLSTSASPFKYGVMGGGVTLMASSPYTSCATTSCACSMA